MYMAYLGFLTGMLESRHGTNKAVLQFFARVPWKEKPPGSPDCCESDAKITG
jgi:hypothetical protein